MTTKNSTPSKSYAVRISSIFNSTYYLIEFIFYLVKYAIFFPDRIFSSSSIKKIWYASILISLAIFLGYFLQFREFQPIGQCILFGIVIGGINTVAHIKKESLQPLVILLSVLLWFAVFHFNILNIPDIKMGWLKWESFFSGIIGYYWFLVRERE